MGTMRRLSERLEEAAKVDFTPSEEPISVKGPQFAFHAWSDHFFVLDNAGGGNLAQVAAEKNVAAAKRFYRLMQDAKVREELKALESEKAIWAWLDERRIAHH